MILLKLVYDCVIGAPRALGRAILQGILDEIDREMLATEDSIIERLKELNRLLESGEITTEEYEAAESELIERLREIRSREEDER